MGLCLIAEFDLDGTLNILWIIGSVACGLGFVIFVHELGHFLVAKMCGVKCEKFYIGFDVPIKLGPIKLPSRLGRFQWGETEYGVGIIPLGGYVKMLGQDDDPRAAQAEADRIKIRKGDAADRDGAATGEETADRDAVSQSESTAAASVAATGGNADDEFELDPRSFPAKTVPQRMAIISAGVIMNLIFAVIFATFAFSSGVSYTPCEVGEVVPGSPAWVVGLKPRDLIVQLGNGKPSDHLRFDWDLRNAVHMVGQTDELSMLVRRGKYQEESFALRPVIHKVAGEESPMLGIAQAARPNLSDLMPAIEGYPASQATPAFEGGDRVVAIDGQSVQDGYQIRSLLARLSDKAVKITVERKSKDGETKTGPRADIIVQPNHIKRLGLVMTPGGISGIYPGSPGEQAGFEMGDVLLAVNGQPIVDPMSLATQLIPLWGTEVEFQVRRGEASEPIAVKATPLPPNSFENDFSLGSPMAVRSLGIVFPVDPTVVAVTASSVAEDQGVEPGDKVPAVQFSSTDVTKDLEELIFSGEEIPLDTKTITWPFIYAKLQEMSEDVRIKLTMDRNGMRRSVTMQPAVTDEFFAERGLAFTRKKATHKAKTWGAAVGLGFRQTKEDLGRVGAVLKGLSTGGISPKKLGGPLSIATVAGLEASESVSRLLIFLTLLSANLAIINFLPIPALDGGHMMFLTVEWVRGKPVDERLQMTLTLVGVACLLGLMLFVSGMDIRRLFF
ncbi:MAG: site-2 protease family protein [Pirellulaceae bacterium]|nr:site-2 protease family protein [Pirellulaceae bacterium]